MEATGITPRSEATTERIEPVEIIREQYDACRQNLVVTSRNRLAKHLTAVRGTPHKEAIEIVDRYCDEENVAIPMYLSSEFAVGWLKVVSVANVAFACVWLWYGRTLHLQKIHPYGLWCLGVIFCGLGVLFWVKSVELEAKNAKENDQMGLAPKS